MGSRTGCRPAAPAPPAGTRRPQMRLRRISDHVLQVPVGATHAARRQHQHPAGIAVSSLVDAASGARSSFGVEVRGLAAIVNKEVLAAPPPELSSALRSLLTRHQVMVCRLEAPLTVPQMQWLMSLLGKVKDGWARCHDGSMRQYLRYDHPSLPEELRHSGIMEHRSGMVVSPNQLKEKYGGVFTATGGSMSRPFVYEGFHTDDSYACTSHVSLSRAFQYKADRTVCHRATGTRNSRLASPCCMHGSCRRLVVGTLSSWTWSAHTTSSRRITDSRATTPILIL
jgi:hypothetical protein